MAINALKEEMEPSGIIHTQAMWKRRRAGPGKISWGEGGIEVNEVGFALTGRAEQQENNTSHVQRWKSTGPGRVRSSAGLHAQMEL